MPQVLYKTQYSGPDYGYVSHHTINEMCVVYGMWYDIPELGPRVSYFF